MIQNRTGAHEMFIDLLNSYQIKSEYVDLVRIQLEKMFNLTNNSSRKEEALYNFGIITDYLKVVDFIEEMEGL